MTRSRVQGRGQVLQLPLLGRGPGLTGISSPAICRSPMAAYELTKEQGFYDANPGTETAILQMTG